MRVTWWPVNLLHLQAVFTSPWPHREKQRLLRDLLHCLEPAKRGVAAKLFHSEQKGDDSGREDSQASLLAVCIGNRSAALCEMNRHEVCMVYPLHHSLTTKKYYGMFSLIVNWTHSCTKLCVSLGGLLLYIIQREMFVFGIQTERESFLLCRSVCLTLSWRCVWGFPLGLSTDCTGDEHTAWLNWETELEPMEVGSIEYEYVHTCM